MLTFQHFGMNWTQHRPLLVTDRTEDRAALRKSRPVIPDNVFHWLLQGQATQQDIPTRSRIQRRQLSRLDASLIRFLWSLAEKLTVADLNHLQPFHLNVCFCAQHYGEQPAFIFFKTLLDLSATAKYPLVGSGTHRWPDYSTALWKRDVCPAVPPCPPSCWVLIQSSCCLCPWLALQRKSRGLGRRWWGLAGLCSAWAAKRLITWACLEKSHLP